MLIHVELNQRDRRIPDTKQPDRRRLLRPPDRQDGQLPSLGRQHTFQDFQQPPLRKHHPRTLILKPRPLKPRRHPGHQPRRRNIAPRDDPPVARLHPLVRPQPQNQSLPRHFFGNRGAHPLGFTHRASDQNSQGEKEAPAMPGPRPIMECVGMPKHL